MTKLNQFAKQITQFSILLMVVFAFIFSAVPTASTQDYVYSIKPMLTALDINVSNDPDTIRNAAISFLYDNSNHSVEHLQGLNNEKIHDALSYAFYLRFRGYKSEYLKTISIGGMRDTTIVVIHNRKGTDVPTLQGMSTAFALTQHDGMNLTNLDSTFFSNPISSLDQLLRFDPSTTECTAYNTAKAQVPDLEQQVASLKADYNEVIGKLESILKPLRKIPGAVWAMRRNPFFQTYENERTTKLNAIIVAESNLFAARGVLNNEGIVRRCKECQDKRANREAAQSEMRQYSKFVDYIQDFREGLNTASSSVPEEQTLINQWKNDINDFNSVMFQTYRYGWMKRNDSLPPCG